VAFRAQTGPAAGPQKTLTPTLTQVCPSVTLHCVLFFWRLYIFFEMCIRGAGAA